MGFGSLTGYGAEALQKRKMQRSFRVGVAVMKTQCNALMTNGSYFWQRIADTCEPALDGNQIFKSESWISVATSEAANPALTCIDGNAWNRIRPGVINCKQMIICQSVNTRFECVGLVV